MKQIVILSGKGGTGKTSVAASIAHLAQSSFKTVLADADVDASNLELVLQPHRLNASEFFGGAVAIIDESLCQGCGTCEQICRFEAILPPSDNNGVGYQIDTIACEGCAACYYQCPSDAIHMETQLAGHWFLSRSRYGSLVHAQLRPAQENSGKLVALVRQQARQLGLDTGVDLIIVDGPPGVGCPVIAASSGIDLVLIVSEPTIAGIHDLGRILEMTQHFRLSALVCINKADIYPQGTDQIIRFCDMNQVKVVGKVPYDVAVTEAMISGQPVTVYQPDAPASQALRQLWKNILQYI
jgi:MinD superfamily P-loop ATPase